MSDILKSLPVNWDLIANPINWATILLMVAFPILAINIVLKEPTTK